MFLEVLPTTVQLTSTAATSRTVDFDGDNDGIGSESG
jgi:hypothetical protein